MRGPVVAPAGTVALIVVAFGGFSALFIVAAAIAALGAVAVLPIKAAR